MTIDFADIPLLDTVLGIFCVISLTLNVIMSSMLDDRKSEIENQKDRIRLLEMRNEGLEEEFKRLT